MVTIEDVANRAGTSVATVSRVLNKSAWVSPDLAARVLQSVEELSYQPHRVARSLRAKTGQIIGLIISDIENFFFTPVVRGVEDLAHENGYTLLLCNSDEDPDKERLYIDTLLAENTAGVIITPVAEINNYSRVLIERDVPVVAIDRRMSDLDVDTVVTDNVGGAFQGVDHLLQLGYSTVGFIGGSLLTTTGRERRQGYEMALAKHGVELDPALIKMDGVKQTDGYQLTCGLLDTGTRPRAIFAYNNLTTLGALSALHEKGVRVPQDIAIVGFDDMPWAPSLHPPLTAVLQPTYEMGHVAADLLLQRIVDRMRAVVEVKLETSLVVRRSCGAAALGA